MSESQNLFVDPVLNELSRRFAFHAGIYRGSSPQNASPLYTHLSAAVATDAELLALVRDADRSTQVSNLLFGSVHFLLLQGIEHPLAAFYASLTPTPEPPQAAYPHFRSFCLAYRPKIIELVATRRIQTNEVQRCTGLLPAFHLVSQRFPDQPLAFVEIGASAGIHLFWDKYGYDYGVAGKAGDSQSSVQINCELQGAQRPPLPTQLPVIAGRVGLDLNPVDIGDESAILWLRALIWPEHHDRVELFNRAMNLLQPLRPIIIAGNAADRLPEILENQIPNAVVCVYHSYTLNQCPSAIRDKILAHLVSYAQVRPFVRVSLEWYTGQSQPQLALFTYDRDQVKEELLAYCESHGRAIEWVGPQR